MDCWKDIAMDKMVVLSDLVIGVYFSIIYTSRILHSPLG